MKTEEEIINEFKNQGYSRVYVWDAAPNEDDPEHDHEFDTKLHILTGSIRIKILNRDKIDDYKLVAGESLEIARKQRHSAVVCPEGCRYIVAEKH